MSGDKINVTGMTGGTAGTLFAVGKASGPVGSTVTNNHGSRTVNQTVTGNRDVVTLAGVEAAGGVNINHKPGQTSQSGAKSILEYTVTDIENLLRDEKYTEDTIQCFKNHGIDGKYFVQLKTDDLLKELGVTSGLQIVKLKTLVASFPV